MKTIHFLSHDTVRKHGGKYYISRPQFINELSNKFNLKLYVLVKNITHLDKSRHIQISNKIEIIDFFKKVDLIGFLISFKYHLNKIKKLKLQNKNDLFLIWIPVKSISILLSLLLKNTKQVIWVKSELIKYKLSFLTSYNILKPLFNPIANILNFFERIIYITLTKNKLTFYTGNILYKTKGKQYSIVSSSLSKNMINYTSKSQSNRLIYIGSFDHGKGILFLLNAMKCLSNKKLIIVGGGGNIEKQVLCKIKKLPNVLFYGVEYNRKKLLKLINKCDILILPSISEKQGKVQLEAMSQGTPVIATNVGGIHTIIKNKYNGLLINPASSKEIILAVNELYNNNALYKKLQKNGYKTAEKCTFKKQINFMKNKINKY
jgi:glycosyltransferase involved in cell wall biosynthesis